jgi:hypothetical protein
MALKPLTLRDLIEPNDPVRDARYDDDLDEIDRKRLERRRLDEEIRQMEANAEARYRGRKIDLTPKEKPIPAKPVPTTALGVGLAGVRR